MECKGSCGFGNIKSRSKKSKKQRRKFGIKSSVKKMKPSRKLEIKTKLKKKKSARTIKRHRGIRRLEYGLMTLAQGYTGQGPTQTRDHDNQIPDNLKANGYMDIDSKSFDN